MTLTSNDNCGSPSGLDEEVLSQGLETPEAAVFFL